jgi:predicted nucleotidyltransferase
MEAVRNFVSRVAAHFQARLGSSLIEAYALGSLAHGGFSEIYSDIDVGLLLGCAAPPAEMPALLADAKALDPDLGKKLSVFWGNP